MIQDIEDLVADLTVQIRAKDQKIEAQGRELAMFREQLGRDELTNLLNRNG